MAKKRNKSALICENRKCNKTVTQGKTCDRCRRAEWVRKNPIRDKFNKIKDKARHRRIVFSLTLEEFTEFCEKTRYHERSGRKTGDLTIDRINQAKGYEAGNIQVMTNLSNITKYHAWDKYRLPPEDYVPDDEAVAYELVESPASKTIKSIPQEADIPF